ncbi:MAG TPA: S8 family serine peptidase [Anaerolineales bacterium]|nr:S8 family serine peptidase [Anaerolineales bacterium]
MLLKRTLFVLIVLALTISGSSTASAQGEAPILGADSATAIPGRYIVVFKPGTPAADVSAAAEHARGGGGQVDFVYESALVGFAGQLPEQALFGLSHNPNIEFIEADQVITIDTTQSPATWGLDRIDQRNLPLNNSYTYNVTGAGVKAYIIDTGIRITHNQFGGRATYGRDFVDNDSTASDCNGHGTHVAGTVGGSTYGVAKGVSLVAVRVLNCSGSGTTSGVIAGIDWVTSQHTTGKAVANMSLGGSPSTALDNAVRNSIADGVVYAIAAGNSNSNACNFSPARTAEAITVGATTSSDARASYSNKGSCLDLFAPGSSITSAWNSSNTATNTISGTSMATPHVTGVAALYLQGHNATPLQVRNALVGAATPNKVTNPGSNSPNLLLYSLVP